MMTDDLGSSQEAGVKVEKEFIFRGELRPQILCSTALSSFSPW